MSAPAPGSGSAVLLPGLAHLLRPLVRLLLRRGITLPMLHDLLRELYVDVARRDVLRDRRAQTDSRISLLTGIHRKELRRQRTADATAPPEPPGLSLSSQIVARWLGGPRWGGADGAPLPLPRGAPTGEASFDALVAAVTRDLRPRAVLDEWLSEGVVRMDVQDRVVLNDAAYLPRPGSAEQLHYFARNLHDHIAAAAANVLAEGRPRFLDRSVHYDALTAAQAARLAAFAHAGAQRLLLEVNRAALAMLDDAPPAPPPTRRVNLGVFLYTEDDPPPGAAP